VWWRIYYGDGRVFTDADGSPFDAPRVDVQVIVQQKGGDYERVCGRDHFYWEPERGGWCNSDIFGAMDHLIRSKHQCLLFGRQMSDEGYRQVHMRMLRDLPPRSHDGYPREHRPE
jgi:hypothetical protein